MWSWEGSGRLPNCLRGEARGELEEKESQFPCLCMCTARRLREFKFPGPGEIQTRECGNDRAGYLPRRQQLNSTRTRERPGFAAHGSAMVRLSHDDGHLRIPLVTPFASSRFITPSK